MRWLRENNHDATSAYEDYRGWEDESILEKAYSEGRIVVTMDSFAYSGTAKKISLMKKVHSLSKSDLSGRFVVVTETAINDRHEHRHGAA